MATATLSATTGPDAVPRTSALPKLPNGASNAPDQVVHVRATCLYVATKLGDLADETVIIGGIVPSLLIDQDAVGGAEERHVGTLDLDVGLALAILDDQRYQALTARLRQAGFSQDENEDGKPTRQRWKIDGPLPGHVRDREPMTH